jgi:hypothetical protein
MQRIFVELIGQLVEAYVDDVVVKSKQTGYLVPDLTTVFEKMRKFQVQLNPEKCVFGLPQGMLLGFVILEHDIEANRKKSRPSLAWGWFKTSRVSNGQCLHATRYTVGHPSFNE